MHAGDPPLVLIERQRGLQRTAIDVVVVRETMRRAAAADSAPRISQPAALQQAPPDVAPVAVQLCLRQVGDNELPSWPSRRPLPVVMAGARLRWRSRKDGLERLLVEAATADGETQHLPYLMGGRRLPLPLSPHLQVAE